MPHPDSLPLGSVSVKRQCRDRGWRLMHGAGRWFIDEPRTLPSGRQMNICLGSGSTPVRAYLDAIRSQGVDHATP